MKLQQDGKLSKGAKIETDNLVSMRHYAQQIPIHKQKKVLNDLSGVNTSSIRGRGVDFSEVRAYQAGDDIRAMDWRVTARNQKPHIKVFREERERPIMIACDLRSSMFFGTRHAFKSVLAADLAALFSWAALNNGDRIGALLFDNQKEIDLRPKPGRKQVMHLLHELASFNQEQTTNESGRLSEMLRHLRRVCKPGSAIYFISDWNGFDEDCERQLYQLSKHNDVFAFQIFDHLEAELPPPGSYPLTDGQQRIQMESFSDSQREKHIQQFERRQSHLKQRLIAQGIPLITLQPNSEVITELRSGMGFGPRASAQASTQTSKG